jgi:hypothetical protein
MRLAPASMMLKRSVWRNLRGPKRQDSLIFKGLTTFPVNAAAIVSGEILLNGSGTKSRL